MASKGTMETCKDCKQFRMLCMCPSDREADVFEVATKSGPRPLKTKATVVTLASMAIYASTWKRKHLRNQQSKSTSSAPITPVPVTADQDQPRRSFFPNYVEPEEIHVTKPVSLEVKRKMMLRLVRVIRPEPIKTDRSRSIVAEAFSILKNEHDPENQVMMKSPSKMTLCCTTRTRDSRTSLRALFLF